MEKVKLGHSDLQVSKICLGTMTFGEQNTEAEGHSQLDYALERGINFIDTAELYPVMPRAETQGATESIIGTWLKKSGRRKDIILATKIAIGTAILKIISVVSSKPITANTIELTSQPMV